MSKWGGRKVERLTLALLRRDVLPGPRPSWRCWACGRVETNPKRMSIEHIVPRSQGGTDAHDNLALSHRSCNSSRGATPVIEWRRDAIVDRTAWIYSLDGGTKAT